MFTNSDSINCPMTLSIVDTDGITALPSDLAELVMIKEDYVVVDQTKYDGSTLNVRLIALTPFNSPVYKDVKINRFCLEPTVALEDDEVAIFTATPGSSDVSIPKDANEYFINSDPTSCPISLSLVEEDG